VQGEFNKIIVKSAYIILVVATPPENVDQKVQYPKNTVVNHRPFQEVYKWTTRTNNVGQTFHWPTDKNVKKKISNLINTAQNVRFLSQRH
jgi:hypothetical protein